MAVLMLMTWPGVTAVQYDQVRRAVNWEDDMPSGLLFHVAAFDAHGAHASDLWATAEDFQRSVEERLMPAVAQLGIPGQPQIEVLPVHAIFSPGFTPK